MSATFAVPFRCSKFSVGGGLYHAMPSRKSREPCPQQEGASRTNVLVPSPGRLSSVFEDSPKPFVEEASGQ